MAVRKQKETKGPRTRNIPQGQSPTPSNELPPLGPTYESFHHFPIMPSNYESIS
jgi:hypothetical protein